MLYNATALHSFYHQLVFPGMSIPHIMFTNGWTERGSFHLRAIRISTAVNIHVQAFGWTYAFISLGSTPKSRMAGSRVTVFNQSCQTFLFSPTTYEVPVSPHPHQHLLPSVFFIIAFLGGVTFPSGFDLHEEHLFVCLLAFAFCCCF